RQAPLGIALADLDHAPRDELREEERRLEVYREDLLEIRRSQVEGVDPSARRHRGVVDEDIDPPVRIERFGDEPLSRLRIAEIRLDGEGTATERRHLRDRALGRLRVGAKVDDDVEAVPRELDGGRPADASRGAGDERDGSWVLGGHG